MGCDVGVTRWSCGISDSTSILDGPGVESRRGKGVGGSGNGGAGRRTRFDCLQYWKKIFIFEMVVIYIQLSFGIQTFGAGAEQCPKILSGKDQLCRWLVRSWVVVIDP